MVRIFLLPVALFREEGLLEEGEEEEVVTVEEGEVIEVFLVIEMIGADHEEVVRTDLSKTFLRSKQKAHEV